MDKTTEQVTIGSTNDEKRKYLFLKQVAMLKAFRDRNAISKEQYDISYNGLITKMNITEQELQEWFQPWKRIKKMLYFEKASDHRVLRYDSKGMYFIEMRNNEMNEIPISLIELRSNKDALLLQAIRRAEKGESKIYAVSPIINYYTNEPEMTFYEVDDYNAVLTAFGLGNSGHRHHIVWQYSKSDTGKGYAKIDLTFKCGCVLHDDNKRTIQKELRDQHKIEFTINSVKWNNDSTTIALDVRRSDLKDKPHELQ